MSSASHPPQRQPIDLDPQLHQVLLSPVKLRLIQLLQDVPDQTAQSLTDALEDGPSRRQTVNAHLRELEAGGWVCRSSTVQKRGFQEAHWAICDDRAHFHWRREIARLNRRVSQ